MDQAFMKEKPVFRLVLSMSLPMVISMLVNSLYNIVDSFFVAKISENAIKEIEEGYISPKPLENECEFCKFKGICKFKEGGFRKQVTKKDF